MKLCDKVITDKQEKVWLVYYGAKGICLSNTIRKIHIIKHDFHGEQYYKIIDTLYHRKPAYFSENQMLSYLDVKFRNSINIIQHL